MNLTRLMSGCVWVPLFFGGVSAFGQFGDENPRAKNGGEPAGRSVVVENQVLPRLLQESHGEDLRIPEFKNPLRDPVSGLQYQKVLYGPVRKTRSPIANYSLWRHVTVYSVKIRREGINDLPALHQSCFDGGKYPIGSWHISRTLSVELRSSLRCGDLGLGAEVSASVSEGRTFSMQRSLIVPEGMEADYIPVLRQEDWDGVTFIQTYEPETGELGFIPQNLLEDAFGWYPFPFSLKNAATVFEVSRQNARTCKKSMGGEKESAGKKVPDLIFPLE